MIKIQAWWDDLAKQARAKGIKRTSDDVEKIWRKASVDIEKEGIKPTDAKFNPELMIRTKKLALQESKFELFLEFEKLDKEKYVLSNETCPKCGHKKTLHYPKQKMYECNNCKHAWQEKK